MRRSRAGVVVAGSLLLFACGGSPPTQPTEAFAACLVGWWIDPNPSSGCFCPEQPECAFSDCHGYGFTGFSADLKWYSGNVSLSYSGHSMSTQANIGIGTYQVVDAGIVDVYLQQSHHKWFINCSSARLTQNDVPQVRPSAALSSAFDAATDGGTSKWTARSF